jgi:hypothetical protein
MTPMQFSSADSAAVFSLHDVSDFPLVRMSEAAADPGYAFSWGAEIQRLLARREPFVLVYGSAAGVESVDDRLLRSAWLRRHQLALGAYCRGLIVLQADIEKRAATRLAALALSAGSGLRVMVISSARVAAELVPVLLKGQAAKGQAAKGQAAVPAKRG